MISRKLESIGLGGTFIRLFGVISVLLNAGQVEYKNGHLLP